MDWKEEIVKLVFVKQLLAEVDVEHIWPHHLPEVAASEDDIKAVEKHLGYSLDRKYADFLRHANGWKGFYQSVDLFGTSDLIDGSRMSHAKEMLYATDDSAIQMSGFQRSDLLPIGATMVDLDIFFLTMLNSSKPGQVIWFAGSEIDRFPDFDEFYLTMVDYNRAEIDDLKKRLSS